MKNPHRDLVIFDAMGVIYHFPEGDDVKYGLWPFLEREGITFTSEEKERYETEFYRKGTLGELSSLEFFKNIIPKNYNIQSLEDEYLASEKFILTANLKTVLEKLRKKYVLGVLSIDFAKWNKKLRRRFDIDKYFDLVVISDEAKGRKPDKKIYEYLLSRINEMGLSPKKIYYLDDSLKNLQAGSKFGFITIYKKLKSNDNHPYEPNHVISNLNQLIQILN